MKTTQRQLEEIKMERDYLDDEISSKDREIHRLEYERLVL
jgi:prefoldin subunit 5